MEAAAGDLHRVELLKSTLQCNDKDKLRRKLEQLKREYLKTAQILRNDEAVQRRARSRPEEVTSDLRPASTPGPGGGRCAGPVAVETRGCPSHRNSPALRLRSRRSLLRWEERSNEAKKVPERRDDGPVDRQEEKEEAAAARGSQEVFCVSESESPSLLLQHSGAGTDATREEELQDGTPPPPCRGPGPQRENGTAEKVGEGRKAGDGEMLHGEDTDKDTQQRVEDLRGESCKGGDSRGGLLDSYTLVDGLLFPAEYYVRTTRRMTLSQSQPDMQAVILSQLSAGRRRRPKPRNSLLEKRTSTGPPVEPQVAEETSELRGQSQSSADTPDQICSDPFQTLCSPGPGRRRGRRRSARCSLGKDRSRPGLGGTSEEPRVSTAHGAEGPSDPLLAEDTHPESTDSSDPLLSSEPGPAPGKVCPGSVKNHGRTFAASLERAVQSWRSLLLPSSPHAVHLPADLQSQQDFHLPDDHFASLKLQKLRLHAAETFSAPPSGNTRSGATRRWDLLGTPAAKEAPDGAGENHKAAEEPPAEEPQDTSERQRTAKADGDVTEAAEERSPSDRPGEREEPTSATSQPSADVQDHQTGQGAAEELQERPPALAEQREDSSLHREGEAFIRTSSSSEGPGASPATLAPPAPSPAFSPPTLTAHGQEAGPPRRTHTLKAPAGGCLLDACSLLDAAGVLCVAAAGKWAVCLWSQTTASEWNQTHTWTFSEPVISLLPVPDAAGLICVTLGQLEIREARVLSCSGLHRVLLCDTVVQVIVGAPGSRVVSSSLSALGSTLQVFTLADDGSPVCCQPLVSPGVSVGALAPVDGIQDALIGTDEGGHLFIWNLRTGQLLQKVVLGDGLSQMSCLSSFSSRGVLVVLLQRQSLSTPEEEEEEKRRSGEERAQAPLFSAVAVNPLSGASVSFAGLHPPDTWKGRLCEADVSGSRVLGLSQAGCACVWDLGRRGPPTTVPAPESEGWQLARWGAGDTLLTGHPGGDLSLHFTWGERQRSGKVPP